MNPTRHAFRARAFAVSAMMALFATLLPLATAYAQSQAPIEPSQMPPRTLFYFTWHGHSPTGAKQPNSLLAMWSDPGFAPARAAILKNLFNNSADSEAKQKVMQAGFERYSPLLENSFVVGYISDPDTKPKSPASAKTPAGAHKWNGMFLVYDRSGKEALLKEALTVIRVAQKNPAKISDVTIAGVPAQKLDSNGDISYWLETGKYAIGASEQAVVEDLLARLKDNSGTKPSLAQSAAYQEAKPLLGGQIEIFAHMPDVKEIKIDTPAKGFNPEPILAALKLDSIHCFAMSVSMANAKSHVQGAILGDASSGTLFDLWPDGTQAPASFSFLSPETVSYNEMQIDLVAFYNTLLRIVTAVLPPAQQAAIGMVDTLAQNRLGMSIKDALHLFTGEFASLQSDSDLDPQKAVLVMGIRQKPYVLKLIRSIFGDRVSSERNEGTTTYLKVSLGGGQSAAGVAQWNFYNLAVTPDFIFANKQATVLRDFIAQHPATVPPAAPQLPADLQAQRAKFPDKLIGLSYTNYSKVDWQALINRLRDETAKAATKTSSSTTTKSSGSASTSAAKPTSNLLNTDWLGQIDPNLPRKYLHVSIGGSWKDAHGVHFEQWVE